MVNRTEGFRIQTELSYYDLIDAIKQNIHTIILRITYILTSCKIFKKTRS